MDHLRTHWCFLVRNSRQLIPLLAGAFGRILLRLPLKAFIDPEQLPKGRSLFGRS